MASVGPSSVWKAQIPSLCHLCNSSPSIQWKCLDCELLMCTNCTANIHSKFKSSTEHKIISTKEIGTVTKDDKPEPCPKHRKHYFSLFCITCNQPVCVDCVATLHKKHEFDSLETIQNSRISDLAYYIDIVKDEVLPYLSSECQQVDRENLDDIKRYEGEKAKILNQQEEIKRVVDRKVAELLHKLEQNRLERKISYEGNREQIDKIRKNVETAFNECKTATKSCTFQQTDKCIANIEKVLRDSKFEKSLPSKALNYLKSDFEGDTVNKLFGALQVKPSSGISFSIVNTFMSELSSITGLCVSSSESAWVFDNTMITRSRQLTKISLGNSLGIIEDFPDIDIIVMTLMPSGDLLLSLLEDSFVNCLKPDGTIEKFIDVSPCLPRGLHVTKSNKIIVGMRDVGPAYPVTSESIRQISIFDQSGKILRNIRSDRSGQDIFCNPMAITSNVNGDICVIDRTSGNSSGRVLVLGLTSEIKWRYEGNLGTKFYPQDITATCNGNIICCDSKLFNIHVLSMNGHLLLVQNTTDLGFDWPCTLDTDERGTLWVGCNTSSHNAKNAKLIKLKYEGL